MKPKNGLHWLILLAYCVSFIGLVPAARALTPLQTTNPESILRSMTPEERVGQLFLVTFRGTDASSASQIYDLILNHHIGGVVLRADNDNFVAEPDTVTQAYQLIDTLQTTEWEASNRQDGGTANAYVPLFIGISQEGDGTPYDQILSGLTPAPDAMAIGATWKPDYSQQVGSVVGNELSSLGFNLFLGPSLDVVESPNPSALSDLGTRVFGGDPFWVGEMGKAYITGLHEGSNNRMLVVARNFPGRGSSDRPPEEEVATVRKSLEQLKQIELSPFFTVTGSTEPTENADGLLVSHIRYQGFQGNIRATTRPVSFDASALSAILALPEFTTWRADGGLIVSDALGSNAVRNFYSQTTENFSPRLVARDAFNAGNDLLYLGNIYTGSAATDTYSATLEILDFFSQEYNNDPVFAQRVDTAVLRILSKKLRMYGSFDISNVRMPPIDTTALGISRQVMSDVARNAATLISPDVQELGTLLPTPPDQGDWIVFLTDTATYQQCSTCPVEDALAVDALQKDVIRLYGQSGSAQILPPRLSSFPLTEVKLMLDGQSQSNIEDSLTRATWIVVSLASVEKDQLTVLRRFFNERPNLVRNKNVILFSFTAPYYLDPTDISKLTAYYALYSKQPTFVDVAARLLFQQVPLHGASPVSIPGAGYDLIAETSPDPGQVIPLALDQEEATTATAGSQTPGTTQIPAYRIGDTIALKAGPILDRNGHIVPDDTVVHFTMSTRDESGGILKQVDATTTAGVARANFVIDKQGNVQVKVTSEPALLSQVLQFTVSNEGAVAVTVIVPVGTPSATEVLPTPTVTPMDTGWVTPAGYPRVQGWFLTLLALFGTTGLVFWAATKLVSMRWALRMALCVLIGGLLGYNYLVLDFPGAAAWIATDSGASGVLLLTFIGEILGGIGAWVWLRWFSEPTSQAG